VPDDWPQVEEVVAAAFGRPQEARLVAVVRRSSHHLPALSLVAVAGDRLVGHVAASRAELRGDTAAAQVVLLGPLAVDPAAQGRGIGSALVRAAVGRAEEAGEPLVVLEGDPAFFGRLGFEAAAPLGVELPLPSWAPPQAGQLLRLRRYRRGLVGRVAYPPAFAQVAAGPPPSLTAGLAESAAAGGLLVPSPDEESAGFWEGTAQGELRMQACTGCGALRFPPRVMCPRCRSTGRSWRAVSGVGSVWSFVVPHPPLLPAYAALAPYNVITVSLVEDPALRLVGNLVRGPGGAIDEVDPATIEIGEPVRVVFSPRRGPDGAEVLMPEWVRDPAR